MNGDPARIGSDESARRADPPRTPLLVENVRRSYRAPRRRERRIALDGVSLRVEHAQWTALLGPNGSGKSTLLRLCATLDTPESGDVRIVGRDARRERAAVRAQLGVVFQRAGLDPLLTVRENLLNQCALHGVSNAEASARVDAAARDFGVSDRLNDRVGTLSGGLHRRVDLARALLTNPALLLLDEPTTGLDHDARAAFLDVLGARRAGSDLTIVMSTHLMDEAERADRVVMLCEGRIVADDAPAALRASLGDRVIRCAPEYAEHLRTASLDAAQAGPLVFGSGSDEALRAAAAALIDAGAPFEHGFPTLGDVYTRLTGVALNGDEGASS